jgi:restriction system protein
MPKRKSSLEEIGKPIIVVILLLSLYSYYSKSWTLLISFLVICFGILLLSVILKNKRGINFFQSKNTLESLRRLAPGQFEDYIVELFRHLGFRTEKVGGSYDGGIDVVAEKDGIKHYIQCKRFIIRQVNVHDVRDFYGAMADKLTDAKGYFITTNFFTLEAEKFAEGKPLELIDGNKLMRYIRQAGVDAPEANSEICPQCGGVLQKRNGKFGAFIGCGNYPKCKFTKPI